MTYQCPLGNMQAKPMNTERIKREAWQNDGILVVSVDDDSLNWMEKQMVINIGNKLFGKGEK